MRSVNIVTKARRWLRDRSELMWNKTVRRRSGPCVKEVNNKKRNSWFLCVWLCWHWHAKKSHIKSCLKKLRMSILYWFCTLFSSILQCICIFNGKIWKHSHLSFANSSFIIFYVSWGRFSVQFESISQPFFPSIFLCKKERFIKNGSFIHSLLCLFVFVFLFHAGYFDTT